MLDHDDEFLPGPLSGLARALSDAPEYGASYWRFEVYEKGAPFVTVGHAFNRLALHEKSFIHHSAVLYRRSLVATRVRYETALDIHDDWDFVLQLSEKTRFRYVDQTTFRWHADVGTSGGGGVGNFDSAKYTTQRNYVRDKWADVSAAHAERWNAAVDRGMVALQGGNLDDAERNLREARARCASMMRLPPLRSRFQLSRGRYEARWDESRQRFEAKFTGRPAAAPRAADPQHSVGRRAALRSAARCIAVCERNDRKNPRASRIRDRALTPHAAPPAIAESP